MSTTSPSPFATDGARKLSPRETMQRLKAISCTLPQKNAPTSCSGQVHVGIFFDGTGNNLKLDFDDLPPEKRKHSNVVKLFQCMPTRLKEGKFAYYIPGVGTPFPDIGDTGGKRGSATAAGGEQRICWALLDLINASHVYVHGAELIDKALAKTISGNMSDSTNPGAMRRVVLKTWQDKLKATLTDQKPRVEQINVSVFGFSRGAAQARAFVNWLFEVCKQEDGGWTFAGLPIRVQFLGIFDTVASVGAANLLDNGTLAGHQSWADNTLEIHPAIEQCVHYVAGHEVRSCFPLDSVRVKSKYPGNALEVMYPGSHSDLGGGYAPGALGIAERPEFSMSVLPGVNMYKAARLAGVPLLAWNELKKYVRESLTPDENTIQNFNAYLKDAKIGSGPVESMHRRHMAHYFSYRFKYRGQFTSQPPFSTASALKKGDDVYSDQAALQMTKTALLKRLSLGMVNPAATDWEPKTVAKLHQNFIKASGLQSSYQERVAYEIAEHVNTTALTPAIEKFCANYIHDSMAGFINFGMNEYSKNGLGIAKFRTVFKGND
jgi:hypothetical protein